MKRLVAGAALLLAMTGCDHLLDHRAPAVYAPWEEGLTLIFTDPSRPQSPRLQLRVKKAEATPDGQVVTETYTTLSGETELQVRLERGRVALALDANNEIMILPEGFPDKVGRWVERGFVNTIIGRARVDLPGVKLPDPDVTGIWIESVPPSPNGVRMRTLFVPDYGDVETLNFRKGQWVVVNRLVSQGYTDPPPKVGSAR